MEIVILGAGKAGKFLYDEIVDKTTDGIYVIGFGDNFVTGEYRGKEISIPKKWLEKYHKKIDAVFIAAGSQKAVKILINTALEYEIDDIYLLYDIAGKCHLTPFDEKGKIIPTRLRKIRFSKDKPTLPYYEVPITDRCNLNCKGCLFGCNSLSDSGNIEYSQLEKDAKRMKELFFDIPWIRILGGEPLFDTDIENILKMYRNIFPDSEIDLCTNGMLIPKMPESFFKVLQEENISVHISGYKPTYHMLDRIDQILGGYNLNYTILKRDKFLKYYTLDADKNMCVSYEKCIASGCPELYKGKLMRCSAVLAFEKFNKWFNTDYKLLEGEDYFNIHKEDINAWELAAWLNKASGICRYCDTEHMESFEWDYSDKNVEINDYIL